MRRFVRHAVAVLALAASGLYFFSPSLAKGPAGGGGGTPAGVIYAKTYDNTAAEYVVHRMNADGSNPVEVYRGSLVWEASHELHDSQRWFLDFLNGSLNAVAEDGTRVVLIDEPDFEVLNLPHWMRHNDDGWVSCEGRHLITGEVGIFVAQVAFDAAGAITGTVPGSFHLVVSAADFLGLPKDHDWGADGRLVFAVSDGGGATALWIADLTKPAEDGRFTPVITGSTAGIHRPAWSPEGSKVAFNEWGRSGVQITILTLATGQRKTISSDTSHYVGTAHWSPTGTHLVYGRGSYRTSEGDILRATADGTNRTLLAPGSALGWRNN